MIFASVIYVQTNAKIEPSSLKSIPCAFFNGLSPGPRLLGGISERAALSELGFNENVQVSKEREVKTIVPGGRLWWMPVPLIKYTRLEGWKANKNGQMNLHKSKHTFLLLGFFFRAGVAQMKPIKTWGTLTLDPTRWRQGTEHVRKSFHPSNCLSRLCKRSITENHPTWTFITANVTNGLENALTDNSLSSQT